MYLDVADSCSISHRESTRDAEEIRHRVGHEGIRFLTYTLNTQIGKPLERALTGLGHASFPYLQKRRGSRIPKLFGGLLCKVFEDPVRGPEHETDLRDSSRCYVRKDVTPEMIAAIRALRQLSQFLWKLEIPYTEDQATQVALDFVSVDNALPDLDSLSKSMEDTLETSARFVSDIFDGNIDRIRASRYCDDLGRFDIYDLRPKHGPGAVATGEQTHEKHVFRRLYSQIERVYPFAEYFSYSMSAVVDTYHNWEHLETYESGTAKVVLVPKDSRGPRLISCEPLEYQWIQQGLGNKVRSFLEAQHLTRGHVNFTDQSVNRHLALVGSRMSNHTSNSTDEQWVTLDMKEASDRVSLALVERLFAGCPRVLEALKATRTDRTRLPNGSVHIMRKFAPMGSNLCFPIESLVFYVLAVASIMHMYKVSRREARRSVYVYGDDIIVSRKYHASLLQYFPTVGLMFNRDKCCTGGLFRESCGCDAFAGVDVTPLRLKKVWSRRTLDPEAAPAFVSLGNEVAKRGYRRTAETLISYVTRKLGPLPVLCKGYEGRSSGLAWYEYGSHVYDWDSLKVRTRLNRDLHRKESHTYQAVPTKIKVGADAWCMVLRRFSAPSEHDDPGVYALPRRSRLQRGWTQSDVIRPRVLE